MVAAAVSVVVVAVIVVAAVVVVIMLLPQGRAPSAKLASRTASQLRVCG